MWKNDETKTKACLDIEEYQTELQKNANFTCICQSCHKKILTNMNTKKDFQKSFEHGRSIITDQFLRTRTKRSSFEEPITKRKLFKQANERTKETEIQKISVRRQFLLFSLI